MQRRLFVAGAILLGVFLFSSLANALDLPKPVGFVNDFANILTASERTELEATLTAFEKETSNEISVVIVPTFHGADRFTYSKELFTAWGIGKKDKNNGILFLIGPKEGFPFPQRGEAFINVGKGLEGALPDSVTGSILRHDVFAEFQAGHYYNGIWNGVQAIMDATKGEYVDTPASTTSKDSRSLENQITLWFWVGLFLLSYVTSFLARTKSWWLGGVFGGVGGAVLGFFFLSGLWIAISAGGLAFIGFIFDYLVSKNYQQRLKDGKPTDFWHSGGGFWFGGGRGGFGGGGGSFGGFGGGGSGGGGAGGGW